MWRIMTTHTMFWESQISFMKKNETKVLHPTVFFLLTTCLIVPQYCVCCHDSSRRGLALSAAYSSLYKLFGKSLWEKCIGFSFLESRSRDSSDVSAQLYRHVLRRTLFYTDLLLNVECSVCPKSDVILSI